MTLFKALQGILGASAPERDILINGTATCRRSLASFVTAATLDMNSARERALWKRAAAAASVARSGRCAVVLVVGLVAGDAVER